MITNDEEIIADIHSSVYGSSEKYFSGAEKEKRVRESFQTFAGQVVYHLKKRDTHLILSIHSFSWFEKLETQDDILEKTLYVYNFDLFNMTACPQFQTAQKRDDQ